MPGDKNRMRTQEFRIVARGHARKGQQQIAVMAPLAEQGKGPDGAPVPVPQKQGPLHRVRRFGGQHKNKLTPDTVSFAQIPDGQQVLFGNGRGRFRMICGHNGKNSRAVPAG